MRQILIDHARKHRAGKRGGEQENLPLEESIVIVAGEKSMDLIRLDEALQQLAKFDEFKSRLVELRYFGGLSVEETAEVLQVSDITVKRHWRMAKAWLAEAISG
jgi:RNA polymerase sigma factor (TIGR02999 family)